MERFYFDQSMKACRQATTLFNDVLSKVLILSTLLIGGGLVLLDKLAMPPEWKAIMLSFFFVGVLLCLIGLFPNGGHIPRNPYAIRRQLEGAIRRKQDALLVACFALVLGFGVGIAGVYVQTSAVV